MTGAVAHPERVVLVHAILRELAKTWAVLAREVPASADGLVRHRPSGWTRTEKRQLQDLQLDLQTLLRRQAADPARAFPRADLLAFLDIAAGMCRLATGALDRGIAGAIGRVYRELYEGELSRLRLMLDAIDEERARSRMNMPDRCAAPRFHFSEREWCPLPPYLDTGFCASHLIEARRPTEDPPSGYRWDALRLQHQNGPPFFWWLHAAEPTQAPRDMTRDRKPLTPAQKVAVTAGQPWWWHAVRRAEPATPA